LAAKVTGSSPDAPNPAWGRAIEYAISKNVVVVRDEGGREVRTEIDYKKIVSGERPELNIYLKPGDTIIAP